MNSMSITLLLSIVTAIAAPRSAKAAPVKELHVAISPFLKADQRKAVAERFPDLVLRTNGIPPGGRLIVWDAWNLVVVAQCEIPSLRFDSPQARAPHLVKPIAAVGNWLRANSNPEPAAVIGIPAVKAPELLELISRQPASAERAILLLGSPLYINLNEPTFSMTDGRYPTDAHLFASAQDSVFGIAGRSNRLALTVVHWCYFTENAWASELHRTVVTRFWALFVSGQRGVLATFGADPSGAFSASLRSPAAACGEFFPDRSSDKLEMRSAMPRSIPLWMLPPATTNSPAAALPELKPEPLSHPVVASLPATIPPALPVATPPEPVVQVPVATEPAATDTRPVELGSPSQPTLVRPLPDGTSSELLARLPQPAAGTVGLGIVWEVNGVDLDLYVKPSSDVPELSYRRTSTREGRYFHDFRNKTREYEYVELASGTAPDRITAWVNYYRGRASGVRGRVCLRINGQTHVGEFELQADHGNRGGDAGNRVASPYWVRLDLGALLRIPPNGP